jgi:hypothetical protein
MTSLQRLLFSWNDAYRAKWLSYRFAKSAPPSRKLNNMLITAVRCGQARTAGVLMDKGASPDAQLSYEHGYTTYHYPLMTEVVRNDDAKMAAVLITHHADLSKADTLTGHTPLHEAAIHDRPKMMRMMLDAGADLDCVTSVHSKENVEYLGHSTALDIAKKHAWKDVEEMLKDEPRRRQDAREAAARAEREAAEAAKKAAEDAARRQEEARLEAITCPKTDTSQAIRVSGPLKFKTAKKAKKWGFF